MVVDLARVYRTAFKYELQKELCPLSVRSGPRPAAQRGDTAIGARMHQRLERAHHEAVIDEEVLFDAETRVASFEVAGAVAFNAMAERQVLSARRRADRVGLHKAQSVEGT